MHNFELSVLNHIPCRHNSTDTLWKLELTVYKQIDFGSKGVKKGVLNGAMIFMKLLYEML